MEFTDIFKTNYFTGTDAISHYSHVIISVTEFQITGVSIFTQPFVQAQIKENMKAPRHSPMWGNSPMTGEFLAQVVSNAEIISIWWRHYGASRKSIENW